MQGKMVARLNSALPKDCTKHTSSGGTARRGLAASRRNSVDPTAGRFQPQQQLKIVVGANVSNAMILARTDYEELSTFERRPITSKIETGIP
jgi:hypothetical protein